MPFKPGVSGNPAGKPKGIKNRETLLKQERRAIFDKRISDKWEATIDALPPTYVADQFMGKAEDRLDVTTQGQKINDSKLNALALVLAKQLEEQDAEPTDERIEQA